MTKEEAKKALDQGEKVIHRFFAPGEYIASQDGKIIDECGNPMIKFWEVRLTPGWDDGWDIFIGGDNLYFDENFGCIHFEK